MSHSNNDEIDLGLVFEKIRGIWRSFLIFIFNSIQFVFRNWIIIVILIIVGAIGGHFWQKQSVTEKSAVLILQNNFNSTSYVYDALDLLRKKYLQGDQRFLKKYGLDSVPGMIIETEIEPIVNIIDLIKKTDDANGRSLEEYLGQSDFEEDVLLSEAFYTEYQYHRLKVTTTQEANNETVKKMIDYLNSNELLQKARIVAIEEANRKLLAHEKSIKDIEGVFESYVDSNIVNVPTSQLSIRNNENNNLHFLLEEKRIVLDKIEFLRTELLKYDEIVTVINDPSLGYQYRIIDNKKILVPILLVLLFMMIHVVASFYKRLKNLAE